LHKLIMEGKGGETRVRGQEKRKTGGGKANFSKGAGDWVFAEKGRGEERRYFRDAGKKTSEKNISLNKGRKKRGEGFLHQQEEDPEKRGGGVVNCRATGHNCWFCRRGRQQLFERAFPQS